MYRKIIARLTSTLFALSVSARGAAQDTAFEDCEWVDEAILGDLYTLEKNAEPSPQADAGTTGNAVQVKTRFVCGFETFTVQVETGDGCRQEQTLKLDPTAPGAARRLALAAAELRAICFEDSRPPAPPVPPSDAQDLSRNIDSSEPLRLLLQPELLILGSPTLWAPGISLGVGASLDDTFALETTLGYAQGEVAVAPGNVTLAMPSLRISLTIRNASDDDLLVSADLGWRSALLLMRPSATGSDTPRRGQAFWAGAELGFAVGLRLDRLTLGLRPSVGYAAIAPNGIHQDETVLVRTDGLFGTIALFLRVSL